MSARHPNPLPPPPVRWVPVRRAAEALAAPVERFLALEAAGGVLLLAAAVAALVWANSPWAEGYAALWHTRVSFSVGDWAWSQDLRFWVNEFLMTTFFVVVGLEIKRELVEGELADLRRAALPAAAALGGMIAPAALFLAFNAGTPSARAWGVPMATDIAFAVGVLTILGKRVPPALRALLLALAILDDIGAVLVIALFYSSGLAPGGLILALAGVVVFVTLLLSGVRPGALYWIPLLLLWLGFLVAGVHPALAGVVAGLLVPLRPGLGRDDFERIVSEQVQDFGARSAANRAGDQATFEPLAVIGAAGREAASPLSRMLALLHPWVAFVVMPLFALANAGVDVGDVHLGAPGASLVFLGVGLGLLIGKPLGVIGAVWVVVRLRLCALPRLVDGRAVALLGLVAGIGFTMALFIAELAFDDPELLAVAKLGVLAATGISAPLALLAGRMLLPGAPRPDEADPAG